MSSLPDYLYKRLPSRLQDAAVSAYGWHSRRAHRTGQFREHRQLLEKLEGAGAAQLRAYQDRELERVLRYARAAVPYYREHWPQEEAWNRPAFDVLASLPYITKSDVRAHAPLFLSEAVPPRMRIAVSTSGTTGTPQQLFVDRKSRRQNHAYLQRLLDAAGVRTRAWGAVFMGRILGRDDQLVRQPWRTDYSSRRVLFSSYHLSDDTIGRYVRKLQALQPEWIDAYPSALWSLAELARVRGLALPRPRAILLSSETLGSAARAVIEEEFSCRVTDFYAAAEQAAFFFQCEYGAYHQHPVYGVAEYLPVGRAADGDQLFEIVATGFRNRAMPLVRYRTGDLVTRPSDSPCRCGLEFPTVGRIVGRYYGLIVTPEGRRVAGIGPALKGLPIAECQLVQYAPDAVEFRVVPTDQGWSSRLEATAIARLRTRIGDRMRIRVAVVDKIPRGPNGKFHMTINQVAGTGASDPSPAVQRDA